MSVDLSNGALGAALLCCAAAMVSLSLLWRFRGPWDRTDQCAAISGLGVVTVLGWAWASLILPETQLSVWLITVALVFVLKTTTKMDAFGHENQALMGSIAVLPLMVQVLI